MKFAQLTGRYIRLKQKLATAYDALNRPGIRGADSNGDSRTCGLF